MAALDRRTRRRERVQPGAPGLGDPFFPLAGNGGYDVGHYALDLEYDRASNQLDGRAIIFARAGQNLSSFNLDLRGYEISTSRSTAATRSSRATARS